MKQKKVIASFIVTLIAFVMVIIWAISYYSQDVVEDYWGRLEYKIVKINEQNYKLQAYNQSIIDIYVAGEKRTLIYEGKAYKVEPYNEPNTYIVTFPSGNSYTVYGYLNYGELITDQAEEEVVVDNSEAALAPFLVKASYEHYFTKLGDWKGFIKALLLFSLALAVFLVKKLQFLLFHISYLFVKEPEPTAFYYIFCKIVMAICMFYAGLIFIKSL